MKLGTEGCSKFLDLQIALGWSRWQVIGLLEGLWLFTAQNTPQGDIGRKRDESIANWLGFTPEEFAPIIQTLIAHRWIDRHPIHRLVIHDWADHIQDMVKKRLERAGLALITAISADNNAEQETPAPTAATQRRTAPNGASREDRIGQDGIGQDRTWIGEGGVGETGAPVNKPVGFIPISILGETKPAPAPFATAYGTPVTPDQIQAIVARWERARAAKVGIGPVTPQCRRLIPMTLDEIANCPELDAAARADPPGFLLAQVSAYVESREARAAPLTRLGNFLRSKDGRRKWLETREVWDHERAKPVNDEDDPHAAIRTAMAENDAKWYREQEENGHAATK